MSFKEKYDLRVKKIDAYIENYLDSICDTQPNFLEAVKYSVLNGGKRIRSILCTEIARIFGIDDESAYGFAAAIEFIHAYSLVHDDLPCMDDDDFRRGMPSCHKKFGESIAVLTGDSLLTLAFELMADICVKNGKNAAKAMKYVAQKAGLCGMINGQVIDINNSGNNKADLPLLMKLVEKKTSELICASVVSPVIMSGADEDTINFYEKFAFYLGIAFQIRDDFEDIDQDDGDDGSPNFINVLGIDKASDYIKEFVAKTDDAVKKIPDNTFIAELTDFLFESFR